MGSLTIDGPALTGEARIEKGGRIEQAVRLLSEEVEKEPLPAEHREQVRAFQDMLLRGGEAAGDTGTEAGTGTEKRE